MKKNIKQQKKEIIVKNISPILPNGIIYVIFVIWSYFVLINFLKTNSLPFSYTGLFSNFEFSINFQKIFSYVYSILVTFFIFLSGFGIGKTLLNKWIEKIDVSVEEKIILGTVSGLGCLSLIVFFIGIFGLLYKEVIGAIILGGSILAILELKKIIGSKKISNNSTKLSFLEMIALLVLVYITSINLLGALTPETFFDSQFYLLGLINQWKLEHKIFIYPYNNASFYPFNINMLYLIGMILNNEITAKLIHMFSGLFICFIIYTLVKKYFSRTTAILSCLIFYSVPLVMMVSWKTAIELGIGLFEITMLYSILNYYASNKQKIWLIISGIMMGFNLGCKYTAVLTYFCIFSTIFIWGILKKEKFVSIIKELFIFSSFTVIVSAVWYVRNFISSGNPVFPFLADKIGFIPLKVTGSMFSDPPHPKFTFLNYFFFLWPLTMGDTKRGISMGALQQETYPGAIFLVFVLFLFLFKKIDFKIKFISIYVFISVILWALIGRFYLRYFIPTLPIISVLFSYYISEQNTNKFFKNILYVLTIFLSLTNVTFSLSMLKYTQDPVNHVLGNKTKKEYLSTQRPSYPCPYYQTLSWANENLSRDAKILFMGETRGTYSERNFYTYGVGDFSPFIEWLKKVKTPDEFYSKLKEEKVTHILFNIPEAKRLAGYDIFYWESQQLQIFHLFWKKYIKEIYHACGDITLRDGRLGSKVPEFWNWYINEPQNYVFLYEILSPQQTNKSNAVPFDPVLLKEIYNQPRFEKLKSTIQTLLIIGMK